MRLLSVKLQVPDPGWQVHIEEAYDAGEEIRVLARLARTAEMAIQMISTAADRLEAELPSKPVRYYILGKTWGWENTEPYTFLNSESEAEAIRKSGRLIFRR